MWSSLPSNLRTVLGTALVLGIGVAAAAFTLSFFALKEAAENPALKFGQGHAWLFPIGVDMALLFFEVLLIAASMVRVQERGRVVQYPRAIPFLLVMVAAAGTLYFNATRVPPVVRPIALAVPVASILVTLGLAYLLKMLAAASGVEAIHLAPPAAEPNRIVRKTDVLHGEIVRGPDTFARSQHLQDPQTGQVELERMDGPAKAELARRVCRAKSPEALAATTASSLVAELKAMGVDLSRQWAGKALADVQAEKNGKS
jgi:Protein of unknown function (DUF2637)